MAFHGPQRELFIDGLGAKQAVASCRTRKDNVHAIAKGDSAVVETQHHRSHFGRFDDAPESRLS